MQKRVGIPGLGGDFGQHSGIALRYSVFAHTFTLVHGAGTEEWKHELGLEEASAVLQLRLSQH